MWTDRVRVLDDVTPADWLAERMAGPRGTVTQTVPIGFAAYARILHPAGGPDNEPVTWAQVAETTGRLVHPTVQWHALVGAADGWDHVGGLGPAARQPRRRAPWLGRARAPRPDGHRARVTEAPAPRPGLLRDARPHLGDARLRQVRRRRRLVEPVAEPV